MSASKMIDTGGVPYERITERVKVPHKDSPAARALESIQRSVASGGGCAHIVDCDDGTIIMLRAHSTSAVQTVIGDIDIRGRLMGSDWHVRVVTA